MNSDKLQIHMFATYANLRVGVAIIAILFPLLLWGGGIYLGISLPDSMSAYYHETVNGKSMRNWFVGILFAVGVILYLYKGYSHQEDYALNFAGLFAIGVAIFPMESGCGGGCKTPSPHGISAVLFFLSIAYVCIRCASDTLHLMKDKVRKSQFRKFYQLIGIGMVFSPALALLLTFQLDQFKSYIFFVEAVGIWIFASYWLVKSWEFFCTNAEHLALRND